MRLNRGQLRTPISILRATITRDPMGGVETDFVETAQTFCEWLPLSANAVVQASAEGIALSAKLHVDLSCDIQYTDKVKNLADSQTYEIISVMAVPSDNKKIVICKASNND